MNNSSFYSGLEKLEWVHIPDSAFVMKYKIEEEGYSVIVSNLREIFGENLSETEIQQRFSDSNPHAEMKTKVIIKNVKHCLEEMINNTSIAGFDYDGKHIKIQLQFCIRQVSFLFNLKPALLSSQELRNHIIVPTLSHTLFIQLENMALKKRINDLENRLNSSMSPQKPLLDHRANSNVFSLNDHHVSDTDLIKAFLEVQKAVKDSSQDKEKLFELHKKHIFETSNLQQSKSSKASVKREIADVSEPKCEIKYEEEEGETSQMPADKRSILPKVKKKKNFKF